MSRSGYNVLSAGSAEEALETSRSHTEIELIITAVVLPQMSGQQLAGKLAAVYPEMKVLFVSGYSQSAVFHRDVPSLKSGVPAKAFLASRTGGESRRRPGGTQKCARCGSCRIVKPAPV